MDLIIYISLSLDLLKRNDSSLQTIQVNWCNIDTPLFMYLLLLIRSKKFRGDSEESKI